MVKRGGFVVRGLVWVIFGVLGFLWGGLIILVLWEELRVLSIDFRRFVLGGEEYLLGVELGGKGILIRVVLILIYAMVMVFRIHYIGLVVGGGYFNWMIFRFVVGVVILLVGLELYRFLVGWEILGVVRFILIGYYCSRRRWGRALITVLINRLGDIALGFMFWGLLVLSGRY